MLDSVVAGSSRLKSQLALATDPVSLRRYKERILGIEEELEEAVAFNREDEIERLEEDGNSVLKHFLKFPERRGGYE